MTLLEPDNVDWTKCDDTEVWMSAKTGIPQAVKEAHKRGLLNPDDSDGSQATHNWPRTN